jgi:hypothetical protein
LGMRISVRQIDLSSFGNLRRVNRHLPAVKPCAFDGQREKDV